MKNHHNQEERQLAASHLAVAQQEAKRLRVGDEGLAECYLILVEAAASWNESIGVPFEQWARQLIRLRTRRRMMDQRVIKIPARIRTRIAVLIDDLSRDGRDLDSPTLLPYDVSLLAAINALNPISIDRVDVEHEPAGSVTHPEVLTEMDDMLLLRYGEDGGGLRTAREVAELEGVAVADVLRTDALFMQKIRLKLRTPGAVPGANSASGSLPRPLP